MQDSSNDFEEQVKWRLENAKLDMVIHSAPILAEELWSRYQTKKLSNFLSIITVSTFIIVLFWLVNF